MTPDSIKSPDKTNRDYKWISQHDLSSPLKSLSDHFCGVACAAIITKQSIPEVLHKIAKITVIPIIDQGKPVPENSWITVPHASGDINILVGPTSWIEKYPQAANFNISPVHHSEKIVRVTPFNLRGWMHDYSGDFFKEYKIIAKKIDHVNDLTPLVNGDQIIMASVKNEKWINHNSTGTHIVLVTETNETNYKIYDPNSNTPGPIWIEKDKFHNAFNGYGTAIQSKP